MLFTRFFSLPRLFFQISLFVAPTLFAAYPVKNIILMVPDGMGFTNVTAARIRQGGVDAAPLAFETLAQIGYQRTHSRNSVVTDSAAAASAWATGQKFKNGEISHHAHNRHSPRTILEFAMALGKATGLVATSTITHATPAAFGAHVPSRSCECEIARQYVNLGIDVLLGGGIGTFQMRSPDPCGTSGDMIALAKSKGFTVVKTEAEMDAAPSVPKFLGLFANGAMTAVIDRDSRTNEPTLKEMTVKALDILEDDPDGFFLMIEGSQIDWANHANRLRYQISETIAFDKSVQAVLRWIKRTGQENETLLIVVPDHDSGGMAINGPYGYILLERDWIEAGWASSSHTACDTLIWSQGPYSEYCGRALDNTHLFFIMKAAFLGRDVDIKRPKY